MNAHWCRWDLYYESGIYFCAGMILFFMIGIFFIKEIGFKNAFSVLLLISWLIRFLIRYLRALEATIVIS